MGSIIYLGIYKLQLSHPSSDGLVYDFYWTLAKFWPSYANSFPMRGKLFLNPFGNAAPNRDWKLYDMIKVIHCWVISVLPSKFQINAMAKYLHFEFWFWHSFWFFTIYRSLKPTPTRWYRVNWSAKKMWRCVSVSSIPLVLLQPWDMDRTPDPISF